MKWWSTISEIKFITSKVRKAGLVKATRWQIHRKSSHFSRTTEERSTTHARELFESALFWSFVLEPDLWNWQDNKTNFSAIFIQIQFSSVFLRTFLSFRFFFAGNVNKKLTTKLFCTDGRRRTLIPVDQQHCFQESIFGAASSSLGICFVADLKWEFFCGFRARKKKKRAQAKTNKPLFMPHMDCVQMEPSSGFMVNDSFLSLPQKNVSF